MQVAVDAPDKDVSTVIIPASAKGQEDLTQLLARLLGQEDNGVFLHTLSETLGQMIPQEKAEAPITLQDLDDTASWSK